MVWLNEISQINKEKFKTFTEEYKIACNGEIIPFSLNPKNEPFESFWQKQIAIENEKTCPPELVPAYIYLIMDDSEIVGVINLRYKNNDFILNEAGNIGYGILPRYRNKGYATEALKLCLYKAKLFGMNSVILTTDFGNLASQKVILKNGGVLFKETAEKLVYSVPVGNTRYEESAMAVVFCKNTILTTRENIYGKEVLSLPKGHIENLESHFDAAVRECFEETNVTLGLSDFIAEIPPFTVKFTAPKGENITKTIYPIVFSQYEKGNICAKESRILGIDYMPIDDFVKECTYENVKNVIQYIIKNRLANIND